MSMYIYYLTIQPIKAIINLLWPLNHNTITIGDVELNQGEEIVKMYISPTPIL
jgi:hypothetical protein